MKRGRSASDGPRGPFLTEFIEDHIRELFSELPPDRQAALLCQLVILMADQENPASRRNTDNPGAKTEGLPGAFGIRHLLMGSGSFPH